MVDGAHNSAVVMLPKSQDYPRPSKRPESSARRLSHPTRPGFFFTNCSQPEYPPAATPPPRWAWHKDTASASDASKGIAEGSSFRDRTALTILDLDLFLGRDDHIKDLVFDIHRLDPLFEIPLYPVFLT